MPILLLSPFSPCPTFSWKKYAQIVVRDYVSGAMENTSAIIYGDFVQKTNRELIDNHNDYYDPLLKEARLARYVDHEAYAHIRADLADRGTIADIYRTNEVADRCGHGCIRGSACEKMW